MSMVSSQSRRVVSSWFGVRAACCRFVLASLLARTRSRLPQSKGPGRAVCSSGDADLPVDEHGEETVAEVGEFLVLGAVAFDEVEE